MREFLRGRRPADRSRPPPRAVTPATKSRRPFSTASRSPSPRLEHPVQDGVHGRRQDDARAAGKSGIKGEGTWKLSKDGFCTTWKGSKANCYTVIASGDNKWSVMKGTADAVWSK